MAHMVSIHQYIERENIIYVLSILKIVSATLLLLQILHYTVTDAVGGFIYNGVINTVIISDIFTVFLSVILSVIISRRIEYD